MWILTIIVFGSLTQQPTLTEYRNTFGSEAACSAAANAMIKAMERYAVKAICTKNQT